jgi:hypothetical protein
MAINGSASFPPLAISINSDGTLNGFAGIVNIGANATANPGFDTSIANASEVQGTLQQIYPGSSFPEVNTDSISIDGTQSKWVNLSTISQITSGGADDNSNGGDVIFIEGPNVTLGDGMGTEAGNADSYVSNNGGNVYVTVDPNKTSWSIWPACGFDSVGISGNTTFILNSTQSAITIFIGLNNASLSAYGLFTFTITGESLSSVALTLYTYSGGYSSVYGAGNWDFSGCILTDASIDSVVQACIASTIAPGSLNVSGTCAPVSSGTLADINTLISLGWTVSYNS